MGSFFSSYHVYSQSYVFCPDGSKKPVTVWAKYLSASKRSHLAPSVSVMDFWVLNYKILTFEKIGFWYIC